MYEVDFKRNGRILYRKYRKYLIPAIGTAVAVSLNEFVDSILVANLLDSRAMTIVNLGMPIQLIICAIYLLFGIGGSTLYAEYMGKRQKREAGAVFSVSLIMAVTIGFVLMLAGIVFADPISRILNSDPEILPVLTTYIQVSSLAAPFMIVVLTLVVFFPAAGNPNLATFINVLANVVNLAFDYIYIHFFHMGVEGAAFATMTGYIAGLIVLAVAVFSKKTSLCIARPKRDDFKQLKQIIPQGSSTSAGQLGYAVQYTLCNNLAASYGGNNGLVAFSVCMQIVSIASIVLQGVTDAMAPLVATLKGQRDIRGVRYVVRSSLNYQMTLSAVLVIAFELFPVFFQQIFNVQDVQAQEMGTLAIRIFAPMILIRGAYILFTVYAYIYDREKYALCISLADGVVTVALFSLLFTGWFGLTGLWLTFPIRSLLILGVILLINRRIAERSQGKFSWPLLLEKEGEQGHQLDISIDDTDLSASALGEKLTRFCLDNNVEEKLANHVGVTGEEMSVYIRHHREKQLGMDVLARVFSDEITLEFRSEGIPFNPLQLQDVDTPENIRFLQKLTSKIENDYILGMNSTRLTFTR